METPEYREVRIAGIRALMDFLEENPVVPLPYFGTLNSYPDSDDGLKEQARAMAPCSKGVTGSFYKLSRSFGPIEFSVCYSREDVCKKTVLRTELVPAQLIDAYEKEIVEWECPDSLLGRDEEKESVDADSTG